MPPINAPRQGGGVPTGPAPGPRGVPNGLAGPHSSIPGRISIQPPYNYHAGDSYAPIKGLCRRETRRSFSKHHETSSNIIKHHQTPSDTIKHHQTSSNIIRHHQTSSNISFNRMIF